VGVQASTTLRLSLSLRFEKVSFSCHQPLDDIVHMIFIPV